MKYLVAFLMCLSACNPDVFRTTSFFAPPPAGTIQKQKIVKKKLSSNKWHQHIIMLQSSTGGASGFAVDRNKFITAAHFCSAISLEQADKIRIHYVNSANKIKVLKNANVEIYNLSMDVCVVRKNNHGIPAIPLAKRYKDVRIMDPVIVGGAPLGYFPYLDRGYVMSTRGSDINKKFDKVLIIKATGTYGISGGPIINRHGEVIGIVQAKPEKFNEILIAVRSSVIKKFLVNYYGK